MKRNLESILKYTQPKNDCWEWTRCYNTDGYPRANIDGNVNAKVHRVVWELANKADATGYVIRHTCDNPRCVRPEHLLLGTPAENVQDRDSRGRNGNAKLTPYDVLCIRALRGIVLQKHIARRYGIDGRTVSSIQLRKHWRWVT